MPEDFTEIPFREHFIEFIKRMKIVLITFVIATIIILVLPSNTDFLATTDSYAPLVSVFLSYISHSFLPSNIKLFSVSISDPITLYVLAAVVFSLIVTMPVFTYQTYKFVSPALYSHEKKTAYPFVAAASILFIVGVIFGLFFLFPAFLQGLFPFFGAVGAEPWFSIMDFYSMLFFTVYNKWISIYHSRVFVLLVKFGVIQANIFAKKRKIYLSRSNSGCHAYFCQELLPRKPLSIYCTGSHARNQHYTW